MSQHSLRSAFALGTVLLLTACSEAPKTETKTEPDKTKEAAAPVEPVTGKTAFYEMYKPARTWATDLEVLSLSAGELPGYKVENGKAGLWTCVFVSPSKGEARTFTYAIADDLPKVHKGVDVGGSQVWSGATRDSAPFQIMEVAYNSDAAYQTASEKAADWLKKNPGKSMTIFLGKAARFPAPVWYIQWGDNKLGYRAFINATTGASLSGK